MLNAQIITNLKKLKSFHNGSYGADIDAAIKALEQQNEDCISRKEAIRIAEQGQVHGYEWQFKKLCTLPSVASNKNKKEWKVFTHSAYHGVDDFNDPIWKPVKVYHCPVCNRKTVIKENFCPSCGEDLRGG